jgi:hypothetical protein
MTRDNATEEKSRRFGDSTAVLRIGVRPAVLGRSGGGHRVVPASTPRMTSPQPAEHQPTPPQGAVTANRFQSILGTRGSEATPTQGTENRLLYRGQDPAVQSDDPQKDKLDRVHNGRNSRAFLMAARKSRSTSDKPLPTIEDRATKTVSTG